MALAMTSCAQISRRSIRKLSSVTSSRKSTVQTRRSTGTGTMPCTRRSRHLQLQRQRQPPVRRRRHHRAWTSLNDCRLEENDLHHGGRPMTITMRTTTMRSMKGHAREATTAVTTTSMKTGSTEETVKGTETTGIGTSGTGTERDTL